MPQMGESIAEGTVSKWLKQLGDEVERDEPILEISTDKVDAEIPAPSAGTLVEISVEEGETVEVGTIVAYIDTEGGAPAEAPAAGEEAEEAEPSGSDEGADEEAEAAAGAGGGYGARGSAGATVEEKAEPGTAEERLRTRSTPVVRRIAEEHGIEIADVPGTGHAGRVTKQDILDFIESGGAEKAEEEEPAAREKRASPARRPQAAAPATAPSDFWTRFYGEVQHPEFPVRSADRVEGMDKIRRLTAEHMVVAKRIAPHVHSFVEIDFTRIDRIRQANKARWKEQGARVSYTAFVAYAVSRVIRDFPSVNSTISGNNIIYRGNVNIGMAVDLDPGLIVPVVKDADDLSLVGIGKKIVDLAERARGRQLSPDEIQGATFSITNPGVLGTLVGMPVIPKGTSAILGTGAIEKRVVVVTDPESGTDSMAIRKRSLFSLGYDHRIVDGADAARFLSALKDYMEAFPEEV
jgi:2-oxoglutarate dehydrogenase E2 component (dihydrolipoamide succinyltransferase)